MEIMDSEKTNNNSPYNNHWLGKPPICVEKREVKMAYECRIFNLFKCYDITR
jgi:hypothetical protein